MQLGMNVMHVKTIYLFLDSKPQIMPTWRPTLEMVATPGH